MRSAGPLALALVSIASCVERLPEQKPTPPDMSALIAAYDHPDLVLDQQTMPAAAEARTPIAAVVQKAIELVPVVQKAIEDSANEASRTQSPPRSPGLRAQGGFEGEGFARVDRICYGWEQPYRPDPANGYLHLTVGFTEQGVDPIIWGTAEACKMGIKGANMTLNGSVTVALGAQSVMPEDLRTRPEIWQIRLAVDTSVGSESWDADFRVEPSGSLQYRVFVGDLFAVYFEELVERGLLAANGRFTCDFDGHTCTSAGASLSW
jgi:hypothetical protein